MRERQEEREISRMAANEKRQRRTEVKLTLEEEIEQLTSTPTEDFSIPYTTHQCFLFQTTLLLRHIFLGQDFRGETDIYATFLRENRDAHHEAGREDFYAACRILSRHADNFQEYATIVNELNRTPEGESTAEASTWTPIHRKLERVAKLLAAEQGLVLRAIRKETLDVFD